jgi:hypothetical protein
VRPDPDVVAKLREAGPGFGFVHAGGRPTLISNLPGAFRQGDQPIQPEPGQPAAQQVVQAGLSHAQAGRSLRLSLAPTVHSLPDRHRQIGAQPPRGGDDVAFGDRLLGPESG